MKFIPLILLCCNLHAAFGVLNPAASWWIDSVKGSDSNNGTSINMPFASLTPLLSATISPNSLIAIKCGSWLHGRLPISVAHVGIVRYGSCTGSNNPLIDDSLAISSGSWSLVSGNVYLAIVPMTAVGGTLYLSLWDNPVPGAMSGAVRFTNKIPFTSDAACITSVQAAPGSYCVDGDTTIPFPSTTNVKVYMQTLSSSSPITNEHSYEYSAYEEAIDSYTAYVTGSTTTGTILDGITTRRNAGNNGSTSLGSYCAVFSSQFNEGTKHNMLLAAAGYIQDSSAVDSYFDVNDQALFVFYDNINAPTDPISFVRVTAGETTYNSYAEGFYGHNFSPTRVTYTSPTIYGTGEGAIASGGTTTYISGANITNVGTGIFTGVTTLISNSSITLNSSSVNSVIGFYPTSTASSMTITGLTASGNSSSLGVFSSVPANINVQNSSFTGFQTGFDLQNSSITLTSIHNKFTSIAQFFYSFSRPSIIVNSDYNSFGPTATNFQNGLTYLTFAQYQALTTQDTHSTNP